MLSSWIKRPVASSSAAEQPPRKKAKAKSTPLTAEDVRGSVSFNGGLDEQGSLVSYEPSFALPAETSKWLAELRRTVTWEQGHVKLFGKELPEPRLTCYYGDPGLEYTYTGRTVRPRPWKECAVVERIRRRVEEVTGESFNTVLCNRYRSGDDTVGWHADDEAVYGREPTIASVSLGAERDFDLRRKDDPQKKLRISLRSGSLLVMGGQTQRLWHHCLPRRKKVSEERINMTFRKILI